MAHPAGEDKTPRGPGARSIGCWGSLAMLAVVLVGLAVIWLARERIAGDIISDMLAERGVEAQYEIESIGTRHQILRNITVGDPARPDLTIERAIVSIRPRLGTPRIDEVRLVRPRLHGSFIDGRPSFGALDPLIFTGEEEPVELPDFRLVLEDGRALIGSDWGALALRLDGAGHLRDGFAGELAAVAPALAYEGCSASGATLYGELAVRDRRPHFAGPLRLDSLTCEGGDIRLAQATVELALAADQTLDGFDGKGRLRLDGATAEGASLVDAEGEIDLTWRDGGLTARFRGEGRDVAAPQARIERLALDGSLRARRMFERIEFDATATGTGLSLGDSLDAALVDATVSTDGTLLAPLLAQVRRRLAAELPGSRFEAELILRRTRDGPGDGAGNGSGDRLSLVVPDATLRGASGAALLALSRFQLAREGSEAPRYSGNLATGGEGLPRLSARIDQRPQGGARLRIAMAAYGAGGASLAIPELALVQREDGIVRFTGAARASGALPGGMIDSLALPLSGSWSAGGGLAMWGECTQLRFAALRYADLALDGRRLTLCPPEGESILRYDERGLGIAAGTPSLRLSGHLGETPVTLASGPVGFALPGAGSSADPGSRPGVLTARSVEVALGPPSTASRFTISDLDGAIDTSSGDIAGRFAGIDVRLHAVPLDLLAGSGAWRYADGQLALSEGAFQVEDRQEAGSGVRRFEPLVARGAELTLADNIVTAGALLREPVSDRAVASVALGHDLGSGVGHADLTVPGLRLDRDLQPTALTLLALGVVANVEGVVTGQGRIDWNEVAVTSSGSFSSESLDLAAAFGPVQTVSGTVVFTDLLGLTTAPDQTLRVGAINPGIEVYDGVVTFELRGGELLAVRGARWPFFGGTLTMRPIGIRFGEEEVRRYVFDIEGLEVALFVEHVELGNVAASGTLDGTIPIVFDRQGNGSLVDGLLLSRPPGGNLSYVGELTYEDLSPTANFAFDALRSLDYRQMRIQMDGSLIGEIVTRVRFDGVSQGEGAQHNFITRRLASLPLRFDVNIRAPFHTLLSSMRSLYDPSALRDPRELGLVGLPSGVLESAAAGDETPSVQPSDSEETP